MACQKTGEILDLKCLQKHYTLHCDILRHTETDKLFFFASRASNIHLSVSETFALWPTKVLSLSVQYIEEYPES